MQPFELTPAGAAQQIEAKALSPVESTQSVLARIETVNPQINAFSNVTADAARARRSVHRRRAPGVAGWSVGVGDQLPWRAT